MVHRKIVAGKPVISERDIYNTTDWITTVEYCLTFPSTDGREAREGWWVYQWGEDDQWPTRFNVIGGPFRSKPMSARFINLIADRQWLTGYTLTVDARQADTLYTATDKDRASLIYCGNAFDRMCNSVKAHNAHEWPYAPDRARELGAMYRDPVADSARMQVLEAELSTMQAQNGRLAERLETLLNLVDQLKGKRPKRKMMVRGSSSAD